MRQRVGESATRGDRRVKKEGGHGSPSLLPPFSPSNLLTLAGGICMGLTPDPTSLWALAWIALVPLWLSLFSTENPHPSPLNPQPASPVWHRIRRGFLLGLLWGIGYHGIALFWITGVHPMTWMGVPWLASLAIAIFCWVFITLWGAVLVAVWAAGMSVLNCRFEILDFRFVGFDVRSEVKGFGFDSVVRVVFGIALWCSLETLWSHSPLWWTSLSYTQSPHNLLALHLARIAGPNTIVAAIVAVNGLLAETLWDFRFGILDLGFGRSASSAKIYNLQSKILRFFLPIAVFISVHLLGFGLYRVPLARSPETAIRIGIVQGNVPNTIKLYSEGWRRAMQGYAAGYDRLAREGVQAVLTPETALPFWREDTRQDTALYRAIRRWGVLAWVGTFAEHPQGFTNTLLTIAGTGETLSRYDKAMLVPLGEYIPFQPILGKLIDRLSPLDAHLVAGDRHQVFNTPFGRAIVGICYDSAFTQHFRRQAAEGTFILTASNNAHYATTMPAQHHAQDVLRAVETDRWAARATNTGYSAIVDPHGRTLWISGINTYEVHADTIYRRSHQTLYVRWGDWLLPCWWMGAIALVAWRLKAPHNTSENN